MMETSLLLETLSKNKKIGSTHLEHHALDVIILSTHLLNKFSHSSALHNDIDAKMRMHAYGCIENLVTKYPLCVKDIFFQIADILFKLLDKEVRRMYIKNLYIWLCLYIHILMRTYAHAYIHTYIHMLIHTYTYTYICLCIHMLIRIGV